MNVFEWNKLCYHINSSNYFPFCTSWMITSTCVARWLVCPLNPPPPPPPPHTHTHTHTHSHTHTHTANTSKYNSSYDTEVRLVEGETGFPSSGIVEVYLNKEWGTVCYDSFQDQHVADTVCRQMGYTSASSFSSVADITL